MGGRLSVGALQRRRWRRDDVSLAVPAGGGPLAGFDADAAGSCSLSPADKRPSDRDHAATPAASPAPTLNVARDLRRRALRYLSRREYSRAELARKLLAHGSDDIGALESVLDSLAHEGWLSDARFVQSLLHRRSSRLGASRVVGELKSHAVDPALIEAARSQLRDTESGRAHAVWRKKYGALPATPAERVRQARFLASRGFSAGTIATILKGLDEDCLGDD